MWLYVHVFLYVSIYVCGSHNVLSMGLCTVGCLHLHSVFPVDMRGASGYAHTNKCRHIYRQGHYPHLQREQNRRHMKHCFFLHQPSLSVTRPFIFFIYFIVCVPHSFVINIWKNYKSTPSSLITHTLNNSHIPLAMISTIKTLYLSNTKTADTNSSYCPE